MNEIAKIEADPVAGTLALIERMAVNPDVDADKMQKLLDMNLKIMDRQAEIEFNQAFGRLSKKLPRIVKKGSVGYKDKKTDIVEEAFKFATYEAIDEKVRPLLQEEGFSLSYDTQERTGGGIVVTAILSHINGHSRTSSIPVALDNSGGKNNIQGMGSSSSYGKRYAMCNILNIVTVGEDDDANSAFTIDTEQAAEIDLMIREVNMNREKFLKVLKVDDVRSIKAKDYARAINSLKAKKYDDLKAKGSADANLS